MRQSKMFIPTLKESPSDAEVISHKLMMRAGMIRKVAAGIYNLLPLGVRVIRNVERIVREEMDRAGAQEVSMPLVIPSELWKESERWDFYGKELLRIKDRHSREFCLGPTHEEVVTDMVRHEVRSYKELPINLYQIQSKFRDEIRPRFGLMRGREFTMKDAYSFHGDEESADIEYRNMHDTYNRIFERCGLEFRAVEAETGAIGGSFSHEFMVLADTGEDAVASCNECSYTANTERADIRVDKGKAASDVSGTLKLEKVATPDKKTIEEVAEFLGVDKSKLIKTLIYVSEDSVIVALVRGDRDVNEAKLKRHAGVETIALADDKTVAKVTGAPVGFAGPVGLKAGLKAGDNVDVVFADHSVQGITGGVTGANEVDMHYTNVEPLRDFKATYVDTSVATIGDPCPKCSSGVFDIKRGIEVGHIFKLGTKYSVSMGATFLDHQGKDKPMIMGCYGIGIGRVAAAAIEQNHDEFGIVWPRALAPFKVHVVIVNVKDEASVKAGGDIYDVLNGAGIETLLDDRNERAGVKFKDSDLIGIPVRVTVGPKALKEGCVELKVRGADTDATLVKTGGVLSGVESILADMS